MLPWRYWKLLDNISDKSFVTFIHHKTQIYTTKYVIQMEKLLLILLYNISLNQPISMYCSTPMVSVSFQIVM